MFLLLDFLLFSDTDRENQTAAKARKLSAIRALYKYLVNKRGYMEVNPTANIDTPKRKKALPKFLTLEEAQALSDRIGIMKRGRLLAVGTVEELNRMAGVNDFETAFVSIVKEVSP